MISALETLVPAAIAVGFAVLTGTAIKGFVRNRDNAHAALAMAWGALTLMSVAGFLNVETKAAPALSDTAIVLFALSGYAFLEHRCAIAPLSAATRIAAASLVAASATFAIAVGLEMGSARLPLGPTSHPGSLRTAAVIALVIVWSGCVLDPAARFFSAARAAPPVEADQLRLLAAAYTGLAASFIVTVGAGNEIERSPFAGMAMQTLVLVLLVLSFAAMAPPSSLRRRWLIAASNRQRHEMIPIGAWYWDLESGQQSWSDTIYRLFDADRKSVPASLEAYLAFVHLEDRAQVEQAIRDALETCGTFDVDHRIRSTSDEERWIHTQGKLVANPVTGRTSSMFGAIQDVTTRKHAEHALREAFEGQQRLAGKLRALDEMKDAILVAVSHELRTPLTVVLGLAATLERDELAELDRTEERALVRRLGVNARRLEKLLSDVLDVDRLARGVIEPHLRRTDIGGLTNGVVTAADVQRHQVHVLVTGAPVASVDPALFERIVENLLANASKHTPDGTPIWVRVSTVPEGLLLIVEDAGPGVPDELKPNVFEPFSHGDTPAHAPGLGVGLSLVSRFAEIHGGRAWIEDRPGGGASFHVLFPQEAAEMSAARQRVS